MLEVFKTCKTTHFKKRISKVYNKKVIASVWETIVLGLVTWMGYLLLSQARVTLYNNIDFLFLVIVLMIFMSGICS